MRVGAQDCFCTVGGRAGGAPIRDRGQRGRAVNLVQSASRVWQEHPGHNGRLPKSDACHPLRAAGSVLPSRRLPATLRWLADRIPSASYRRQPGCLPQADRSSGEATSKAHAGGSTVVLAVRRHLTVLRAKATVHYG